MFWFFKGCTQRPPVCAVASFEALCGLCSRAKPSDGTFANPQPAIAYTGC